MISIPATSLSMPATVPSVPTQSATAQPAPMSNVDTADLSSASLLALTQDVQGLAIQAAAGSNSSSSKATSLSKMVRNLNMV